MKTTLIIVISVSLLAISGYVYYYNYVQTLWLSDIVNVEDNSLSSIFVELIDFDTGLTRHELNGIIERAPIWTAEINRIETISNPYEKEREREKLISEMMADPGMKKVVQKLLKFGFKMVEQFIKNMLTY